MIIISSIVASFFFCMIGMYLVKDYRKGIYYKGIVGKIQKIIAH
jgi:hypothetical protein